MEANILGISPGARHIGIAVIENNELVDSRVIGYYGKWNDRKLRKIIRKLTDIITTYTVQNVALKAFHPQRCSPDVHELIKAINLVLSERRIVPREFNIDQIKDFYISEGPNTKLSLGEALIGLYPELYRSVQLEKRNHYPYYQREFEAVAMAHLLLEESRL